MKSYRLVLLEGDGIGKTLCGFWARILPIFAIDHGFRLECRVMPFGKSAYERSGDSAPKNSLGAVSFADATLLFGLDAKGVGKSPVGTLRRELDLYADVRPIKSRRGRWSYRDDLDIVFIRECTQGFLPDRNMYAGSGEFMPDPDTALSVRVVTRSASERIARFAFNWARTNNRKKITALHKAPLFTMTCGMFLDACRSVAAGFPDIEFEEELVDNAANRLIARPESIDVMLATNLFGDILSDEAAALVSSLAPSMNLGDSAAVFLPVNHQPAYVDVAHDAYDPLPSALCVHMLLRHLGEERAAQKLDDAIELTAVSGVTAASAMLAELERHLKAER